MPAVPAAEEPEDKELFWLAGEVKTPPFSAVARVEAGRLLRQLQQGVMLSMPHSRPMPSVGPRCHELRVVDGSVSWRVFYRVDDDLILVLGIEPKKTRATPKALIDVLQGRLRRYDEAVREAEQARRAAGRKHRRRKGE